MPRLALPMLGIGFWSSAVTCFSKLVHERKYNASLAIVLGIVVGLALNFRSTSAYDRYNDGRKQWANLTTTSQNLARIIWMHTVEREDEELGKQDLLGKVSCLNLITAFAFAVKHKMRYEPFIHYEDMQALVAHLDTFAKAADTPAARKEVKRGKCEEYLGIPMMKNNPRVAIKATRRPLGSLPLEILGYLSRYVDEISKNGTFTLAIAQVQA